MDSNAQKCLNEIWEYLYGENTYTICTGNRNQSNEEILRHIKEDYKPRRYVEKEKQKEAWKNLLDSYRRKK